MRIGVANHTTEIRSRSHEILGCALVGSLGILLLKALILESGVYYYFDDIHVLYPVAVHSLTASFWPITRPLQYLIVLTANNVYLPLWLEVSRPTQPGSGLISGGVYVLRRSPLLDSLDPSCSLERDAFPRLAQAGRLLSVAYDGYFIDIGVPVTSRGRAAKSPSAGAGRRPFSTATGSLIMMTDILARSKSFVGLKAPRLRSRRSTMLGYLCSSSPTRRGWRTDSTQRMMCARCTRT